jgi:hypothetical protein
MKGITSAPLFGAVTRSTSFVSLRIVYLKRIQKNINASGMSLFLSCAGGIADLS